MEKIQLSEMHNGTIKVYRNIILVGAISEGHVRGEWWVEPLNKAPKLVKGKKEAIKYLLCSA